MVYNTLTLKDVSIGIGRYGIAASAVPFNPDLPTYLRITDIKDDGTIDHSGLKSVNHANSKNYILEENDIVFARTGASTGKNYFYNKKDGIFVYAGFLIKFSIDPKKVNPMYVKYFCRSKIYNDWVNSFNTGSTRGNINAQTLGNMPISIPTLEYQKYSVSILSAFDDKIEINNKIIANLEEQAQTLYKSWFIDFDPFQDGEFEESELGMIPKGWRVVMLNKEIAISKKSINPDNMGDDIIEHYSIPAFDNKKFPSCDNSSSIKSLKYIVPNNTFLISKLNPSFKRIWNPLHLSSLPVCSTEFIIVAPNKSKNCSFYFELMNNSLFYDWFKSHATGTVGSRQRVSPNIILGYEFVLPEPKVIDKFSDIISDYHENIKNLQKQNQTLAELRDTLLPKLMSGEIELPDETKK